MRSAFPVFPQPAARASPAGLLPLSPSPSAASSEGELRVNPFAGRRLGSGRTTRRSCGSALVALARQLALFVRSPPSRSRSPSASWPPSPSRMSLFGRRSSSATSCSACCFPAPPPSCRCSCASAISAARHRLGRRPAASRFPVSAWRCCCCGLLRELPEEAVERRVDRRCGYARFLWHVVLPLSRPISPPSPLRAGAQLEHYLVAAHHAELAADLSVDPGDHGLCQRVHD